MRIASNMRTLPAGIVSGAILLGTLAGVVLYAFEKESDQLVAAMTTGADLQLTARVVGADGTEMDTPVRV